ncbi:MAG: hypothetical protein ACT4QA_20295 [Panacagrimonas sp.]
MRINTPLVRTAVAATMALLGFQAMARGEACVADFGNPPRPITGSLQGTISKLISDNFACVSRGGEAIRINEANGAIRLACLRVPPGTSANSKRPLITFLSGARSSAARDSRDTGLEPLAASANLSGDPTRRGFILLLIEGRDTEHYYPAPADKGTGWDNWYRNVNRDDPDVNVDVAAIDAFIARVEERGIVDPRRKYMLGWSNGGAMALLYGMNTPGIAATATYSSPDPYSDQFDPCQQTPFASNPRPLMTLHNRCDIFGLCATGALGFRSDMTSALPQIPLTTVIINTQQQAVASCEAACSYDVNSGKAGARRGSLAHVTWPRQWTDDYLSFFAANALPPPPRPPRR